MDGRIEADFVLPVNCSGVKWFERRSLSSSRKSEISVRPRGTRPAPPVDETNTPFEEYLNGDEWEFRTSTLHYKSFDDEFWLHIGFKRIEEDTDSTQTDAAVPKNRTVLGIDLGVETLAVASTGTFWTGGELDHWHREFQQRRGDLQQTGT